MNYEKSNSLSLLINRIKQQKPNKEKLIILLFSVIISILFVSTITYGATTIGNNITSGGNLTNTGTATVYGATSIGGAITATSTLTVTGLAIFNGNATTTQLTVNGPATLYGATSIGGALTATSTLTVTGLTTLGNATTSLLTVSNGAWFTNGNIGIGTTSPWGLLSINPNGISGPSFVIGSSTATNFVITNSGNVGIGTTSPGSLFSLNNIANLTTATSSFYGNGINLANGCFAINGTCVGAGGGSGTINSGTTGQLSYYAGSGTTLTATSSIFLSSNQNIGIGTTTPNWLLQVAGTRPFLTLSDTGAAANNKHWFLSSQGGNFYVGTSSDAYATSTISALTINSNSRVGVGTTTPFEKFAVQGGLGADYLTITGALNSTSTFSTGGLTVGISQFVVQQTSGNVGIGTTVPISELDIVGTSANAPNIWQDLGNSALIIRASGYAGTLAMGVNANTNSWIQSRYSDSNTYLPIIMNLNGGGVGIGTSPAGTFEVDTDTTSGVAVTIDQDDVDQTALDLDINNTSGTIIRLDWGGATTQATAGITGLAMDFTNLTADGINTVYGLHINDHVGATASTEYAIYQQGTNWDFGAYFEDTIYMAGNVGIGTTTPNWLLQVAGTRPFLTLSDTGAVANNKHWFLSSQGGNFYIGTSSDAYSTSTSNLLNLISSNYSVGIGTTSPAEQLSVSGRLFVGGTGTSTIQNNLYVMGTLRSAVSYVGDLIFSNNFRFIETNQNEKIQSLFLQNQYGENIFKIDENGKVIVREIEAEIGRFKQGNFEEKLQTKELQIGSSQNRTGITIYDKKTGDPVCVFSENNVLKLSKGKCE